MLLGVTCPLAGGQFKRVQSGIFRGFGGVEGVFWVEKGSEGFLWGLGVQESLKKGFKGAQRGFGGIQGGSKWGF